MKKLNILSKLALVGLALSSLMIFYAYVYVDWAERTGRTVGASIGGGVVGIFGLQLAALSGVLLVASIVYAAVKNEK